MPPEFPPYELSPPTFWERLKHAWLSTFYGPQQTAKVGERAPYFLLLDPRSRTSETNETYKLKTLVLKFCASWCAPCQWELKDWIQFHRTYWRENLVIIGVYADYEKDMLAYTRKNKVLFTCCTATSKILWDYNVYPEGRLPRTTIIATGGIVAWDEPGYHQGDQYMEKFKPLLGPK